MATFKFLLHRSLRGEAYEGTINIRLIHKRKVKVTTTKIKLYAREWDPERQQVILPSKESDRYDYLCRMSRRLNRYRREFEETMEAPEQKEKRSLWDMAEHNPAWLKTTTLYGFIEEQAAKLSDAHRHRTARAYRTAGRGLIDFNQGKNLPLRDIDFVLINDFDTHLRESGKSANTISFYMRMLRAIYQKAIAGRVIKARRFDPFEGVFTGFEQNTGINTVADSDPLSLLEKLPFGRLLEYKNLVTATWANRKFVLNPLDHTLHEKNLYDSWRYFFFCYHAGISFMDMACLRKEHISQDIISYYHSDTKETIDIPLSPILKQLIESFSAEVKHIPYLFPVILDEHKRALAQCQSGLRLHDRQLKRLALMAGIGEDLSAFLDSDPLTEL